MVNVKSRNRGDTKPLGPTSRDSSAVPHLDFIIVLVIRHSCFVILFVSIRVHSWLKIDRREAHGLD
jgi:hypothetical protein